LLELDLDDYLLVESWGAQQERTHRGAGEQVHVGRHAVSNSTMQQMSTTTPATGHVKLATTALKWGEYSLKVA
jgi:hypothetical protein